ncbi:MAG: flavin-containing monooxygenase [Rubrimonas sp.]|uniref:flavin-containing monooxygenase n=1 Tax=Rubrimonas sp. TaxID=2036015 RepID=UPI002FDE96A9
MTDETVETLVIGGGQAGLAMSAHLRKRGRDHLVLERGRVAERWRSWRWDALRANGPAWHDRFPDQIFEGIDPDAFPSRDELARYFETFAERIAAPVRCGVEVTRLRRDADGAGYRAETSHGAVRARNVVLATGPFQKPLIPACAAELAGVVQMHSTDYRNPAQLPEGAALVVGGGSSGAQIAEELARAGRRVFLSVGAHDRPPRRYRGRDYCWWLGVLGKWDAKAPAPGTEHIAIAVSGAYGGRTMDFRRLAEQGVTLLGRIGAARGGALEIAPDLAGNIARGDANYLSVLREADAYAARHGLDLPPEPEAHRLGPLPACVADPILRLDLAAEGIGAIVWATGFALDFGWVEIDVFDAEGRPRHADGVSDVPGLYFLGLPWLTCRGSSFIWGAWRDAETLAGHIDARG